jgi:Pyridine nucleotide-disulphide oxidoreductase, dimerisation domain/Dehydrogenase E1 component/Pyridine nucleotide-disulphide oxidoreductase
MSLSAEVQIEMYRRMLRIRYFEEAATKLKTEGVIPGSIHTSIGQEGEIVGACMAVRKDDYMLGNHRSHGHPIGKGAKVAPLMAELLGRKTGVNQGKGGSMHLAADGETVKPEFVVVADARQPSVRGLGLDRAGLPETAPVAVDAGCRTAVAHIFAAGDVTGGAYLTTAAEHAGSVAGANAAGDDLRTDLDRLPVVLNTFPEIAYVGLDEPRARTRGGVVRCGYADLQHGARNLTRGGLPGAVKVIADGLGQILGVHAVGTGAGEIVTTAAALMQSEALVENVAALRSWHPSAAESLAQAAAAVASVTISKEHQTSNTR